MTTLTTKNSKTIKTTQASFEKPLPTVATSTITVKTCKEFKIDQKQVCLEFIGRNQISQASSLCSLKHGKLPLPTNQKENDDYLNAFVTMMKEIGETRNTIVPLDVNDLVSEGHFVTYTGKTVEWFNWYSNQPDNWQNEDYVHMYVIIYDS